MSAVVRQQPPPPTKQCNTVDAGWETRDDPETNLGKLGSTSKTSIQPIYYTHKLEKYIICGNTMQIFCALACSEHIFSFGMQF